MRVFVMLGCSDDVILCAHSLETRTHSESMVRRHQAMRRLRGQFSRSTALIVAW